MFYPSPIFFRERVFVFVHVWCLTRDNASSLLTTLVEWDGATIMQIVAFEFAREYTGVRGMP
jgi:hypothetical protein